GFRGLKLSATCWTMLRKYPGKGNSIPSVRTVATSVPAPPVSPPPAVGAFEASTRCADLVMFVVARVCGRAARVGGFTGAAFTGSGASALEGAAAVGGASGGVSRTMPVARGPGGAATRSTRYIGGNGAAG